jgi:hypothetical protein
MKCQCCGRPNMHETIDMAEDGHYYKTLHCPYCMELKFEELICPNCHYVGAIIWNPHNKVVQCRNCRLIVDIKVNISSQQFGAFRSKLFPKPKVKVLLV